MQRIFFALIAFLCTTQLLAAEGADSNIQLYVNSHVFGYSETAPVHQLINDFEGPYFEGGKHSFTHNIWEIGGDFNGFKAAYFLRYDYYLNYTQDAAEIIYGDKNDISIEKNRDYDIYLDVKHIRADGFKVGYESQVFEPLDIGIDVSYIEVNQVTEGVVQGHFIAEDDNYIGQLDLDYIYSKDKLLEAEKDWYQD